jgi:glycogen synthase kinase 3 beta
LYVESQRRSRLSAGEAALPSSPLAQSAGPSPTSKLEEAQEAAPAQDNEPQCTYNAERVIGNGTFGIVYSAHIVETDETVAIKKVFVDRRYRNRELQLWREMRHPNIVTLKHAFYTSGDSPDELYLNMVMEYVPETVYCVMKRFGKHKQHMPEVLVQLYAYQACRALAHLHASSVVHRDIKPQNLLVDATRGHLLKLCDFGSAARLGSNRPTLVAYICSRYYRAPELIFGATNYTTAVDLWSIGCVLAEMLRGKPLFPGENGVDQLVEIVKVLGAPSRRQVLAMNQQYFNFAFPNINARSWDTVFSKNVGQDALSLLTALLQYDPEQRVRPLEACAHHFFDELRDERKRCPDGQPLPTDLYNLTSREGRICAQNLKEKLIPAWHRSSENGSKVGAAQQAHQTSNGIGEELG